MYSQTFGIIMNPWWLICLGAVSLAVLLVAGAVLVQWALAWLGWWLSGRY